MKPSLAAPTMADGGAGGGACAAGPPAASRRKRERRLLEAAMLLVLDRARLAAPPHRRAPAPTRRTALLLYVSAGCSVVPPRPAGTHSWSVASSSLLQRTARGSGAVRPGQVRSDQVGRSCLTYHWRF